MESLRPTSRRRWVLAVAALLCVSLAGLGLARGARSAPGSSRGVSTEEARLNRTRQVLGSELSFAAPGAPREKVQASVKSVAGLIDRRSGMRMCEETQALLEAAEEASLKSGQGRIPPDALLGFLSDTLTERLAAATDGELRLAATVYLANSPLARGVTGVDDADRSFTILEGLHHTTLDEFQAVAQGLRTQARSSAASIRTTLAQALQPTLDERLTRFAQASPSQFQEPGTTGLTPAQAFLLTYSVLAEDALDRPQSELDRALKNPLNPRNRPFLRRESPDARPFGPHGRLRSTPLDLVMNRKVSSALLDRFTQKGGGK